MTKAWWNVLTRLYCKFTAESNNKRIVKIGIPQHGIEEACDLRDTCGDVDADDCAQHVVDRAPRLSSLCTNQHTGRPVTATPL